MSLFGQASHGLRMFWVPAPMPCVPGRVVDLPRLNFCVWCQLLGGETHWWRLSLFVSVPFAASAALDGPA